MIHLSDEDKKRANGTALKIITDNANNVLSGRTSKKGGKGRAILAIVGSYNKRGTDASRRRNIARSAI